MKITATSDWRDAIAFETPVLVSELVPGEETRCSTCGGESQPLPRTELWAFKHRHPHDHAGYVRFYCQAHIPVVLKGAEPVEARAGKAAPRRKPVAEPRERESIRRSPATTDTYRAMCPDCHVEVSAKGLCGMCGQSI